MKHLTIWSDGPSSQFKNCFIVKALSGIACEYKIFKLEWCFLATAHGKGPVYVIGGSSKRSVRKAVLRHASQVSNSETFANLTSKELGNIRFL